MSFLFKNKSKAAKTEWKGTKEKYAEEDLAGHPRVEEQVNKLHLLLAQKTQDNIVLKELLEDQRQTTMHNKKLLEEYIGTISNHDQLVNKLQENIESLTIKLQSQALFIEKYKQESHHPTTAGRSTNPTTNAAPTTLGDSQSRALQFPPTVPSRPLGYKPSAPQVLCPHCNGLGTLQNTQSHSSAEKELEMLRELRQTKEELNNLMAEVQKSTVEEFGEVVSREEGGGNNGGESLESLRGRKSLMGVDVMEGLQGLLEEAHVKGEILVFLDATDRLWQIAPRDDIRIEGKGTDDPALWMLPDNNNNNRNLGEQVIRQNEEVKQEEIKQLKLYRDIYLKDF